MASKYWIKLYIETLFDPKVMMLGNEVFGVMTKLFLLAGHIDQDGQLPKTEEIAWYIREDDDLTKKMLQDLAEINIIKENKTGWIVTNYAKRQAPISDAERARRYRERKQRDQYSDNGVTKAVTKRDVESESESESESDKNRGDTDKNDEVKVVADLYQYFESNITMLTPRTADMVDGWMQDYPIDWIYDAINVSVDNSVRKPSYVDKVLQNWQSDGRGNNKAKQKKKTIQDELEALR
jgi:DnaD/phage-associated family protein